MTLANELKMYEQMLVKAIAHWDEHPLSGSAARDVRAIQEVIQEIKKEIQQKG